MAARLARYYLIALLFFCWGMAAARFEVFPWKPIAAVSGEVAAFVRGDPGETTGLLQKIGNDAGLSPQRFLRPYDAGTLEGYRPLLLPAARARREAPMLRVDPAEGSPQRIIVGAFDFEDAFWGALLLDDQGRVVHRWPLRGEDTGLNEISDVLKNLYGVAFFPDGSAIFNLQEVNGGLTKVDACGQVLWAKAGDYHHVVSPTEDFRAFWTFGGLQEDLHPHLLLIDAASGQTLRDIDMREVARANPEIFLFDLQRESAVAHATHPNDIEPLSAALAAAFPGFAPGDLAVSYHTTNLIFVLDPVTLEIKWWYSGAGDGQHDPDWEADGTITIFNNRWRDDRRGSEPASTIVAIDPRSHSHHTLLDGARYGFYSRTNGRHQVTDRGSVLVTSSRQGRVFEVDLKNGEVIFDFVNVYDRAAGQTLHLSEAFALRPDFFTTDAFESCQSQLAQNGGNP